MVKWSHDLILLPWLPVLQWWGFSLSRLPSVTSQPDTPGLVPAERWIQLCYHCPMGVQYGSALAADHMTITGRSCDYHIQITWLSHVNHVTITCRSCDYHMTTYQHHILVESHKLWREVFAGMIDCKVFLHKSNKVAKSTLIMFTFNIHCCSIRKCFVDHTLIN